jgi:hypothetical protein
MASKKKGNKPVEPLAEDPESQPRKGKKRGERPLPVVGDALEKYADLDEAMVGLRELREEWAEAGQRIDKARVKIHGLLKAHGIQSYAAEGLIVDIDPGEEQLRIRKLRPPKDDKKDEAA